MEPIQKAVAKALRAKRSEFAEACRDNKSATSSDIDLNTPQQEGVSNSPPPRFASSNSDSSRREAARSQLFPTTLNRAATSPARVDPGASSQSESPKKSAPSVSDEDPLNYQAQPARRGPNGNLAIIDPAKLDALIDERLKQEPDSRAGRRDELSPDTLNSLRLLDREFGNWESDLKANDLEGAKKKRDRTQELLQTIPDSIADRLQPTFVMLNEQTVVACALDPTNSESAGHAPQKEERETKEDRAGKDIPINQSTRLSARRAAKRRRRRR